MGGRHWRRGRPDRCLRPQPAGRRHAVRSGFTAGGHAHTHDLPQPDGSTIGVDTGFIGHNGRTYPTLMRLFAELGVETQDSEMSMSIRCDGCGLEYAGARGIIARPSSLPRGRYLRMLHEVIRFYRKARAFLDTAPVDADNRDFPIPSCWTAGGAAVALRA